MTTLSDCRIIKFDWNKCNDISTLSLMYPDNIPFSVNRLYYLYQVPQGAKRGGHAHKELEGIMLAVSGSFDVILHDGHEKRTFRLDCNQRGLFVPKLIWREVENFTSDAICLVLASGFFREDESIQQFNSFLQYKFTNTKQE